MKVNELVIATLTSVLLFVGGTVTWAQAQCTNCVPGNGSGLTDCNVEWSVTMMPPLSPKGLPKNKLVCYEGDPRCDFDSNLLNSSCTFHLGLCINNNDSRLPLCQLTGLSSIQIMS